MSEDKNNDQYLKAFEILKRSAKAEPSWLLRLREEAMASFARMGFPSIKDDAWRYTDLASVRDTAFISADEPFQPARLKESQKGVEVLDIAAAVKTVPELMEKHLGQYTKNENNPFIALNTGLFTSGTFIRVSDGMILSEPLRLVHSAKPVRGNSAFQTRTLILMGKGSKATVLETYDSPGDRVYFTNAVTEIVLEEGSVLEHCKIQQEHPTAFHIATTQVMQHRASSFVSFALSTGARLMRHDCRVALAEEGASCALSGLYLGDREQLLDYQTFVDHQKPDGKSDQFFKGLLSGNSRGVFRGHIIVRQDAQRTDAHQTNKNLLLSDTAKIDTQPQLEILADDVKCSHGAAIGQLQEDAFFYLRSRGIGQKEAAHLLAQGFAREAIDRSGLKYLKETLLELVNEKLSEQLDSVEA